MLILTMMTMLMTTLLTMLMKKMLMMLMMLMGMQFGQWWSWNEPHRLVGMSSYILYRIAPQHRLGGEYIFE